MTQHGRFFSEEGIKNKTRTAKDGLITELTSTLHYGLIYGLIQSSAGPLHHLQQHRSRSAKSSTRRASPKRRSPSSRAKPAAFRLKQRQLSSSAPLFRGSRRKKTHKTPPPWLPSCLRLALRVRLVPLRLECRATPRALTDSCRLRLIPATNQARQFRRLLVTRLFFVPRRQLPLLRLLQQHRKEERAKDKEAASCHS